MQSFLLIEFASVAESITFEQAGFVWFDGAIDLALMAPCEKLAHLEFSFICDKSVAVDDGAAADEQNFWEEVRVLGLAKLPESLERVVFWVSGSGRQASEEWLPCVQHAQGWEGVVSHPKEDVVTLTLRRV